MCKLGALYFIPYGRGQCQALKHCVHCKDRLLNYYLSKFIIHILLCNFKPIVNS